MNAKQLKEWEAEEAEHRFVIDCCVEEFQKNSRRSTRGLKLSELMIKIIVTDSLLNRKNQ
jgi:hypothetical protein